jgi:hypothetical protein
MSSLKDRRSADKAIAPSSNGKKPKSAATKAAAERKAKRHAARLEAAKSRVSGKEKRKLRRAAQRIELASVKSQLSEAKKQGLGSDITAPLVEMVKELSPKPLPPEPNVFAWMDWARETGNIIHCGRRKLKYRLSAQRGASIVAFAADGRKLVRLPSALALEVFGKV